MKKSAKVKSMPVEKVESSWLLPESRLREIENHARQILELLPRAINWQVEDDEVREVLPK
jgi:hypothetical protein